MHAILEIIFLFLLFSILGWIMEAIFRSIVFKRFSNPGFMTGITLPIYGFGGIILILIGKLVDLINTDYKYIVLFILSAIIMTAIEYIGGYIFIKYYNIKLWDYSNEKFNYKGIICPLFTMIWGMLGVIFYAFLYEHLTNIANSFLRKDYLIFVFGIFFGIFLVDLFFSLNLLNVIKKYSNIIKEIINVETLKIKISVESRKISLFPNIKLGKYIKNKLNDLFFLKERKK